MWLISPSIAEQEAYGRVKLCKTMVADHFIPAYLASLGSFIDSLERVAALTAASSNLQWI